MTTRQYKHLHLAAVNEPETRQDIFDDRRCRSFFRRADESARALRNKDKRLRSFERRRTELNNQRQDNWWLCVGYVSYGFGEKKN